MKDYGTVTGSMPQELEITETKVFIASDITEIQREEPDTGDTITEYQFNLVEYDKDEYIKVMAEAQEAANEAIDYLLMGGE